MEHFKAWFEQKYIEWQSALKRRGSIREFSEHLGIDERLVSNWMNGHRRPGSEYIERLAIALGIEVYDALNLPPPDENLMRVKQSWDDLSEADQEAYAVEIERIAASNKQKTSEKQKSERSPKKPPVTRAAKPST
jgi:transcriptional regulator with XRE-family HTH domain